jgi:hypothetical protein
MRPGGTSLMEWSSAQAAGESLIALDADAIERLRALGSLG